MDHATKVFFQRQQQDPANQSCIDSGAANPQWASVSHGCYMSLEASGVHRSLGVHISFVRSISMDSWKPIQLKLMELGGNKRLQAFFREHGIADNMPIVQKYNTRAAEWYRKNLRAEAEGTEQPPPLPKGVGCLPANGMTSHVQSSASKEFVIYSDDEEVETEDVSRKQSHECISNYHTGTGYHGSMIASGGAVSYACSSVDGPRLRETHRDGDDFFTGLLGQDVGTKVSGGFWSAVNATKQVADQAKKLATDKVNQAQNEGWIDAITDTTKLGMDVAVEKTTWAAQKGVEVGKTAYSHVSEKGGKEVLNQTAEVLGKTAKSSMAVASTGLEWFNERIKPIGNEAALKTMSTGRMQGFGSDCLATTSGDTRGAALSYHEVGLDNPQGNQHVEVVKKRADIWNDDMWDD